MGEQKNTREELKRVRECIKNKCVNLNVFFEEESQLLPISLDWAKWGQVEIKELDVRCPESTVSAIRGGKGSFIEPHFHNEQENIYIVSGLVQESESGNKLKAGQSFQIEPKTMHSLTFLEDSMVIMQWVPKLV